MQPSPAYLCLPLLMVLLSCGNPQASQTARNNGNDKEKADPVTLNQGTDNPTPEPPSRFIINDGCPLDDKIQSIELITKGRKIDDHKLSTTDIAALEAKPKPPETPAAVAATSASAATTAAEKPLTLTEKLTKLFRAPKEPVVVHELVANDVKLPLEFYTDAETQEEAAAANKYYTEWSKIDINLLDNKGAEALEKPIAHSEDDRAEDPSAQAGPKKFLFVNRGNLEVPLSSDLLFKDLGKLSMQKQVFAFHVVNKCAAISTKCGDKGLAFQVEEAFRYQLETLEVRVNGHTVFKDKVGHIFANHAAPAELAAKDDSPALKAGRSVSIDIAASSVFKKFVADKTPGCSGK